MCEWISVNDRLPKVRELVITFEMIYDKHPHVSIGSLWEKDETTIGWTTENGFDNVSYWMPLPEPPE